MLIAGGGMPGEMCDFVTGYITCGCRDRVIPMRKSCQRSECPICYEDWASKAGGRVSDNLRGTRAACRVYDPSLASDFTKIDAIIKKTHNIRHITFSPPPGLIPDDIGLDDAFKVFLKLRKNKYMLGGWVWFHPYRIRPGVRARLSEYMRIRGDEQEGEHGGFWRLIHLDALRLGGITEYVYWSPHYHVLGFGGLPDAGLFHRITGGWTYKNHGPRNLDIKQGSDGHWNDEVKNTASYLSTHCGIEGRKMSRRVFGICHSSQVNKVKDPLTGQYEVRLVKKSYLKCPKCGEYLTIHRGIPGDLTDTGQQVESKLVFYRYKIREKLKGKARFASPPAAMC